jgi:hypothetical protein
MNLSAWKVQNLPKTCLCSLLLTIKSTYVDFVAWEFAFAFRVKRLL